MDAPPRKAYLGAMAATWLIPLAVVLITVIVMEFVAAATHRFIMHGPGWNWHRSHHEPHGAKLERNDLYALVFACLSFGLFVAGARWPLLWWVALGMSVYGLLYAFVHDGLVHRRFGFVKPPRNGFLRRLVQAHRLHHAVRDRRGAVSFGFLYAPPVASLVAQLRRDRGAR